MSIRWSLFVLVYVCIVGFEDVEEAVDVCLGCCTFDFFLLLLIDAYFVEVCIHGFFVDSFGAYYKV